MTKEKINTIDIIPQMISSDDAILVTGPSGFIGQRVVASLIKRGYHNLRLLVRPSSDRSQLRELIKSAGLDPESMFVEGNLLNLQDCVNSTKGVKVVYHLAAGTGQKAFAAAFLGSVVTTRNLLEGCVASATLKRFVNISSFAVYSNRNKKLGGLLDESSPMIDRAADRGGAYCYAKVKQDELVMEYGEKHGINYVLMRPGVVYGPGRQSLSGRVGLDTFGFFAHLGGGNQIPLTYVDNCSDAIVLAGITPGVEKEIFNIVDDDLPTSRQLLRSFKKNVRWFISVPVPKPLSFLFCWIWEKYSKWSEGQLPPAYNRMTWHAYWKRTRYSNTKLKIRLNWKPSISYDEGLARFFEINTAAN